MSEQNGWKVCRYTFAGEELFDSEEDAKSTLQHLESLQPENHYEIVEVTDSERSIA